MRLTPARLLGLLTLPPSTLSLMSLLLLLPLLLLLLLLPLLLLSVMLAMLLPPLLSAMLVMPLPPPLLLPKQKPLYLLLKLMLLPVVVTDLPQIQNQPKTCSHLNLFLF